MNCMRLGYVLFGATLLLGCASPRMYYWGDYSETLYQSKKNSSDNSLLSHQQSLEKIVEESGKRNIRIPPGVYAELGYIYYRQNKKDLAIHYFKMEKELYPESTLLMDRLAKAASLSDKPKTSEDKIPPTK